MARLSLKSCRCLVASWTWIRKDQHSPFDTVKPLSHRVRRLTKKNNIALPETAVIISVGNVTNGGTATSRFLRATIGASRHPARSTSNRFPRHGVKRTAALPLLVFVPDEQIAVAGLEVLRRVQQFIHVGPHSQSLRFAEAQSFRFDFRILHHL